MKICLLLLLFISGAVNGQRFQIMAEGGLGHYAYSEYADGSGQKLRSWTAPMVMSLLFEFRREGKYLPLIGASRGIQDGHNFMSFRFGAVHSSGRFAVVMDVDTYMNGSATTNIPKDFGGGVGPYLFLRKNKLASIILSAKYGYTTRLFYYFEIKGGLRYSFGNPQK